MKKVNKYILEINNEVDIKNFYNNLNSYIKNINKSNMELIINNKISDLEKYELKEIEKIYNIKDSYKRLSYTYDSICDTLDKYVTNNICEFDDKGLCIAERNNKTKTNTNGCCGKCIYVGNKGCTIKSLTCKMFYCKYIKSIKQIPNYKDIKVYKYFLTKPQKLILETSFWTTKEENMKKLYKSTYIRWLFMKNKEMKRY